MWKLIILFLACSWAWASHSSSKLPYIEYMTCFYSLNSQEYCDENDEIRHEQGYLETIWEGDYFTIIFKKNQKYKFKIISIKKDLNEDGENVNIMQGVNEDNEKFMFVLGPDYFNLIKHKKWGLFFTSIKKQSENLKLFDFGTKIYNVRSFGMCDYNLLTENYDENCTTENFSVTVPIKIQSRLEKENLYIKIDTLAELQFIHAEEDLNSDGQKIVVFSTYTSDLEKEYLVMGPDYFNFADGKQKISFSEGLFEEKSLNRETFSGSGVAIAPDILITNAHVIKGLSNLGLFQEGKHIETDGFEVIGEFSEDVLDLAILRVKNVKLDACPISNQEPKLGQDILVFGFPQIQYQGTDLKVTKGIVSGKNGFKGDKSTFQIDAAVQHGNSGGPIVSEGKIIGLVMAYLNDSQNVNFGIKASKIYHLLNFHDVVPKPNTTDFSKCTYLLIGE